MKLEYRRNIRSQSVILTSDGSRENNSYEWRMITENEIPGFLSCTYESFNGKSLLAADVTGMKPLSALLKEKPAGIGLFEKLVSGILSALESLDRYLLDADGILLLPETVFLEDGTGELGFLYYPDEKQSARERLKNLAGFLLSKASEDDETVHAACRFFRIVNENDAGRQELQDFLRSIKRPQPEETVPENFAVMEEPGEREDPFFTKEKKQNPIVKRFASFREKLRRSKKKKPNDKENVEERLPVPAKGASRKLRPERSRDSARQPAPDLSGETAWNPSPERSLETNHFAGEVPEDDDATVFLKRDRKAESVFGGAWLVPADIFGGETVELKHKECLIGRGRAANIIDPGSGAVSRRHAALTRRGKTYVLSDLGSKNGTFLNGIPLAAGEEKELADGDVLKFADAEYHFCLTDKQTGDYTVSDFIRTDG